MSFSDKSLSTFEALILECSLESALLNSSFMSDDSCITEAEMNRQDYEHLQSLAGNDRCADCDSEDTEWASVSFGIFICANCSGMHR